MDDRPYVFIDVETTGGNYQNNRIMEIGAIRIEAGRITTEINTLINPHDHIPPFISRLTGINREDVDTAPDFNSIKHVLADILTDAVFVAHNARFDYGFIKAELKRVGIDYQSKILCTARLSRHLFPQYRHHNLSALIDRYHLTCPQRHRAYDDALALYQFIQHLTQNGHRQQLDQAIAKQLQEPILPPQIKTKVFKNLPEHPGVYIFFDADHIPLYIGKSVNLKNRVRSHFSNATRQTKERNLTHDTVHIETILTGGDFGAKLLEAQLIKSLFPMYNRALRRTTHLATLIKSPNPAGYDTITIKRQPNPNPQNLYRYTGAFRSIKQAKSVLTKLTSEYQLCPKLMGIQHADGACFASHLGECLGACTNQENPLKYNLRLIQALSDIRLMPWPFPSPIAITETTDHINHIHLFDQWCFLGTFDEYHQPAHIHHLPPSSNPASFDLDLYKILLKHLKSKPNQVTPLDPQSVHLHSQS